MLNGKLQFTRVLLCPRCTPFATWHVQTSALFSSATSAIDDTNVAGVSASEVNSISATDTSECSLSPIENEFDEGSFTNFKEITRQLWEGERERFPKSYTNGRVHVTSANAISHERSIIRLSMPEAAKRVPWMKVLSKLPVDSLAGLKGALADCKQPAKVLQNNADELSKQLANRRFPATPQEIGEARRIVMDEIRESDIDFQHELRNPKSEEFLEKMIYRKAQQYLKKVRYNWKSLSVNSREEAASFALSRLAPYYAEMERVLAEFKRNSFIPETVLDFGSGVGSAFWAAHAMWGEKIQHYCLVDQNYEMRNFSMDIMRGPNYSGDGAFVNKSVYFRKNLMPSDQNTYDLVILHRTLIEIPSREERLALIEKLWQRTNKFLVIVETPLVDGFKALMEARDFILTAGNKFDFEVAKEALDQMAKLDMATIHFLANKRISDYEKLCVVQEKLGDNFQIPTTLDTGYVYAPCPHDQGCPKLAKWLDKINPCDFHVRWAERRVDHKTASYNRDGTLTGKFSYVIMAKGQRPPAETTADGTILQHPPRILRRSEGHGCSTCTICTANDGLQNFTVSKRAKHIFKRIIAANESQLLPVDYKLVKSSSGTTELINDLIEGVDVRKIEEN